MRLPLETIINCIQNCSRQFSFLEHDIWAFTWKTENNAEDALRPFVYKLIANEPSPTNEDMDIKGIPFTKQLQTHPEHAICRVGHYATLYGVSYVFDEIEKSGIKYEYALRTRNDLDIGLIDPENWLDIIKENPKTYITPEMPWCPIGINDHLGFGAFENVRNVWTYDEQHFKKTVPECWNPEAYIKTRTDLFNLQRVAKPVTKYIVKRNQGHPGCDSEGNWVLK